MSRNLCRTDCYFCKGKVEAKDPARAPTVADCGRYFESFSGMRFAQAECVDCEAKYLAWYEMVGRISVTGEGIIDLSFRSSFNDEPGPDDYPRHRIERVPVRSDWARCSQCGKASFDGVSTAPSFCSDAWAHEKRSA